MSNSNDDSTLESAPGWDAIDAVCERVFPGQEPPHYGTVIKYAVGGDDPIDGISVYRTDDPVPGT